MTFNQLMVCIECPKKCNDGEFCLNASVLLNEEMANMTEEIDECESLDQHFKFAEILEKLVRCKADLDFQISQLEHICICGEEQST